MLLLHASAFPHQEIFLDRTLLIIQWIWNLGYLYQLTFSALLSSCLEFKSLWNKNPTSWWILVSMTSHLSDLRISYNAINFGMRKKSNHLLLLCSCSTSLIQFVSTWWAMDACYIKKQTKKTNNQVNKHNTSKDRVKYKGRHNIRDIKCVKWFFLYTSSVQHQECIQGWSHLAMWPI